MAENNKDNVGVGKPMATGLVWVADIGATIPTNATTPLDQTFENTGYISEDGLTNSISTDNESIKDMGGEEVVSVRTSRSEQFKFTGIETNEVMLGLSYGDDNVGTTDDGLAIIHNNAELPFKVLVLEIALSPTRKKRIVVPQGKVIELGEVSYKRNQAVGYPITVAALKDAAGNTAYEYIAEVS